MDVYERESYYLIDAFLFFHNYIPFAIFVGFIHNSQQQKEYTKKRNETTLKSHITRILQRRPRNKHQNIDILYLVEEGWGVRLLFWK